MLVCSHPGTDTERRAGKAGPSKDLQGGPDAQGKVEKRTRIVGGSEVGQGGEVTTGVATGPANFSEVPLDDVACDIHAHRSARMDLDGEVW
jgi:hypothetical protein